MNPRRQTELVVDANVARAASSAEGGGPPDGRPGGSCGIRTREVLEVIRKNSRLGVVFSPRLLDEWKKHEGNFARKWRLSMVARKRCRGLGEKANRHEPLEEAASSLSPSAWEAVRKDSHLIAAALLADGIVVSLDRDFRGHLVKLCASVGELASLRWCNPCDEPGENGKGDCKEWLRSGFPGRKEFRLCP